MGMDVGPPPGNELLQGLIEFLLWSVVVVLVIGVPWALIS